MSSEGIGCCFDGWTRRWERRERKKGLRKESAALRDGLVRSGIEGMAFLEVGCGIGGLTRALIKMGARRGVGVDLSAKAIETARRLAAEEGMLDRAEFHLADGSEASLPEHEVLVMDKVICCYPDPGALIPNSISSDTVMCGAVIPISAGMVGRFIRSVLKIENLVMKLRKIDFRAFVHKQGWIDELFLAQGLAVTHREVTFPWVVSIYQRADRESSESLTAAAAISR